MCGITGYFSFTESSDELKESLISAVDSLGQRGPDNQAHIAFNKVGLGHTRLSILDTSELANQPMTDPSGRYTLVFNGEIYNYKELSPSLENAQLQSTGDTEVLLHLLIQQGADCLPKLNGFYALAFYDKEENTILLARDQMGIKPLHYFQSEEFIAFGSEMKALMQFPFSKQVDQQSLYWYLKLNYLPAGMSMLKGVKKLLPGHWMMISSSGTTIESFTTEEKLESSSDYASVQTELIDLLEKSVTSRLISDVPLGSFLSGGTDSSAIVALASRHHQNLNTFSIGYTDNPFFDETHYAEIVAKKFKTNHTTFKLSINDMLNDLDDILNYIDEPFADSSAIPTYILSKRVRQHVTVALSGDGADELFGGYYKHQALARGLHPSSIDKLLKLTNPIWAALPSSRSGKLPNLIRRMNKLGQLMKLSPQERYWYLASLTNDPSGFLKDSPDQPAINALKNELLSLNPDMQDYLRADQAIVLSGDMLTKVDLMSMANSLEVRVPFLDKRVVDFANNLPSNYKVNIHRRKRIVQDAFKSILPKELYQRPKKGFEVPLLDWMRKELLEQLDTYVFDKDFLENQGLFNSEAVLTLRTKLLSNDPGDVHGILWALFVFQRWHQRCIN